MFSLSYHCPKDCSIKVDQVGDDYPSIYIGIKDNVTLWVSMEQLKDLKESITEYLEAQEI